MLYRIIFITFMLLLTSVSSAEYEGKKRLKTSINYNGSATLTIESDLEDRFNYIRHTNANGEVERLDITSGSFEILGAGMHELKFVTILMTGNGPMPITLWIQDVYVPYPQPELAEELAKQYMPVSVFHKTEEYFPQSLEAILSFTHEATTNESINIRDIERNPDVAMGEDLKTYLEYNGHSSHAFNFENDETVCAMKKNTNSDGEVTSIDRCDENQELFLRYSEGDITDSTVYWDASQEGDYLYLSYYFFYAFDAKEGSFEEPGTAAHAFDRESATIKFQLEEDGSYTPLNITYAGHLEKQILEFYECDNQTECEGERGEKLLEWSGGKTTIGWDSALKAGNHPILYKAKGAHAIYPTYGNYNVVNYRIDLSRITELPEPAGSLVGSKLLLPGSYGLEKLDFESLKYLAFSGSWVDVIGLATATFPPFMRTPYSDWLSDTNYVFFNCLVESDPDTSCIEIKRHFNNIKGLNDNRPLTVEVLDSSTGETIQGATVEITSAYEGFETQSGATLANGIHTFFIEAVAGITYQVSSTKAGYSDVICDYIMFETATLIPNGGKIITCVMTEEVAVTGTIQGSVVDAVLEIPVVGSEVRVFQGGIFKEGMETDAEGFYSTELPVGEYSLMILAEGYITEENVVVEVTEDERTTVTALRQVPSEYEGDGTVGGTISDAISGNALSSVNLKFRLGINVQDGTVINSTTTTDSGAYEIILSAGNYTVEASKEGYTTRYFNIVSIGTQVKDNQNSSISPIISEDEIRIVLDWGATPSDLDSHLWTPNIEGSAYHVYYSSRGSVSSAPYAQLDTDDTNGYGPETITLTSQFPGTYYYSVFNYSGSPDIKISSAKVEVYNSTGLVKEYIIPLSGEGRYWNVFSINGADGEITSIDEISSSAPTISSRGTSYYKTTGKSGVK